MVPVICFVGMHNSGKTTFIERLVPELVKRGYRVGTVKHDVNDFEIDQDGKDTWRHYKAGSSVVAISSPAKFAIVKKVFSEAALEEIVTRFFADVDIVIAEGFKKLPYPKIEVFRKSLGESLLCSEKDNIIALVSDDEVSAPVPRFSTDRIGEMATFIEDRYLKGRKSSNVVVLFDGKKVPMNDFVRTILLKTLEGFCSALRGWEDPKEIMISIKRDPQ